MLNVADIANYDEKIESEKQIFEVEKYSPKTLIEVVAAALSYSHDSFHSRVRSGLGMGPWDYMVSQVDARPGAKVLSVGSGACGLEIALAKRFTVPYRLTCLDLNESLLELGKEKAALEGISMDVIAQDANFLKLSKTYDVILAHAALHHFVNFEHIFAELHDHLSPTGVFIAFEPVPRNGMLLWPETKELINRIFEVLPARYRRVKGPDGFAVYEYFPEADHSQEGFECIRSQDVVPLLEKFFHVEAKIAGNAFTRRFVDGGLGDNYDLTREEDRVLLDVLIAFDEFLTNHGVVRPETVFMVMKRNQ